jgi:dGTPase
VQSRHPNLELGRFIGELTRGLMSRLIGDLLTETTSRLRAARPETTDAVRKHGRALVAFSAALEPEVLALKSFLFTRMYRHPKVMEPMTTAKTVIADLCETFSADPSLLPADWAAQCGAPGDPTTLGVVRDYIAGMTDRYALAEHARITHTEIAL